MRGNLAEQFEILRRILDRMQSYAVSIKDHQVVDYAEHLRNEIELLKGYIKDNNNGL